MNADGESRGSPVQELPAGSLAHCSLSRLSAELQRDVQPGEILRSSCANVDAVKMSASFFRYHICHVDFLCLGCMQFSIL
jgi:hypothetical protein